jgi:hypothetical protein
MLVLFPFREPEEEKAKYLCLTRIATVCPSASIYTATLSFRMAPLGTAVLRFLTLFSLFLDNFRFLVWHASRSRQGCNRVPVVRRSCWCQDEEDMTRFVFVFIQEISLRNRLYGQPSS